MSRAKSKTTVTSVDLHAVPENDAEGYEEVRYHDGSTFTFDLHFHGKRIKFVSGVATVDAATAKALREGGHIA